MLDAGTPDMRLAVLAEKYEQLLDDVPELGRNDRRLREAVPRVRALCDELAAFGLPETIDHDDFHDGQVFVRDGRYLLLDWGDACVTHPFFTLAVTLGGVLSWGLDDVQHSVDVTPFLDAYLEPFGGEAALRDAAAIALELGWICRSVNAWHGGATVPETQERLNMFFA
jgi:Ser/Thr protein kinase RdoA (MazF antagonist)